MQENPKIQILFEKGSDRLTLKLKSQFYLICILVIAGVFAMTSVALAVINGTADGAAAPTIQSDLEDYAPIDTVTLTGSNWQPGETVNIWVNDDEGSTWNRNADVVADENGNVRDEFQLPSWFVATYSVKATGSSGAIATSTFTDASLPNRGCPAGSPIVVTTPQDELNTGAATGTGCSLREAIAAANADDTADTITLPAGLYPVNRTQGSTGPGEDSNATGDLDILQPLTINGGGARSTTILGSIDRVLHVTSSGSLALSNATVTGGRVTNAAGGGIRSDGGPGMTLTDVTVANNSVINGNDGGGIYSTRPLTINQATISGNSATGSGGEGGGLVSTGESKNLTNVTITNNSATANGGGFRIEGGTTTFTNVTVSRNSSTSAGSNITHSSGTLNLRNTIVSDGTALNGTTPLNNCTGAIGNTANNLDSGTSCGFGAANSNKTASLGALQNNGGPTDTRALGAGSDATNAGTNTNCPATDQRGQPRPRTATNPCDIGAYEVQNTAPATTVPAFSPASPKTNDPLQASTTTSDADGNNVSVAWVWKVTRGANTCQVKTDTSAAAAPGARTSSLDLSQSYTTSNCTGASPPASINPSKGDTVVVEATPNDGTVNGTMQSKSVVIENSAPTCDTVSLTTDEDTTESASPDCTDADGDTLTYSIVAPATKGTASVTGGQLQYEPNANANGDDTFTYKASDGAADSNTATVNVTINAVNDAPENTVPDEDAEAEGNQQSTDEDTALTFGSANQVSVSDLDAGNDDEVRVTLSVTNGTLTLSQTTGLTFDPVGTNNDGTDDAEMVFTGTISDINAALDGLGFDPDADYYGSATLTIETDDQGNAGSGGALSDSDTVDITVNPVNDPPTVSLTDPPDTANEGDTKTYDFEVSDPDSGDTFDFKSDFPKCGTGGELVGTPDAGEGSFQCKFPDGPASPEVEVQVTDSENADSNIATQTVQVSNVAPTIDPDSVTVTPGTIDEGGTSSITASASDPADTNDELTYSYDCDGDGTDYENDTGECLFDDGDSDGTTYTVGVKVDDGDGGTDTDTTTVTVNNVAPTATLGNDEPVDEGEEATISFTNQDDVSSADEAAGFRYEYDCDGSPFSGAPDYATASASPSTTCEFEDDGEKTVSARIIDKDNGAKEYATTVTVENVAPAVTAPANQSADEGDDAQSFDLGSFTDPGADGPWAVSVDWGDGSTESLPGASTPGSLGSKSHTYADNDTYTVTVTVSEDGGTPSDSASFEIVVDNVAPTVTLSETNLTTVNEDRQTERLYQYTISDPGDDTVLSVDTTCGANGAKVSDSDTNTDTSGSFKCVFPDGPENSIVSASATDSDDDKGEADTQTVNIANVKPTAELSGPTEVLESTTAERLYTFTVSDPGDDSFTVVTPAFPTCGANGTLVSNSLDTEAPDFGFKCVFPDGGPSTDPTTSNVAIRVMDDDNATDTDGQPVTVVTRVDNVAPEATFNAPESVNEGQGISLSLDNATDPAGSNDTLSYAFDCGGGYVADSDGSFNCPATTDDGTVMVKGQVKDEDGGVSEYTDSVSVHNVVPVVTAADDQSADEGESKSFDLGSFTDPGDDGPWNVNVDWGDGSSTPFTSSAGSLGTKSHAYADDDTYTVTVTVSEAGSGTQPSHSAQFEVAVSNVDPVVTAADDQSASEGTSKSINLGSFADPGADGPWSVSIDWGDNSQDGSATVNESARRQDGTFDLGSLNHTYADDGTYTVTVTVSEAGSGTQPSDSKTFQVTVANVAPTLNSIQLSLDKTTACLTGGNTATLTFSATDPAGSNDTVTLNSVNWGDGTTNSSNTHTYSQAGTYTVKVKVADEDGGVSNELTKSNAVALLYKSSAILEPINGNGSSVFKSGATIPVKVKITDCDNKPVDGSKVKPKVQWGLGTTASPAQAVNEPTSTSAADTGSYMRYDATGQQWIYNLASKSLGGDQDAKYWIVVRDDNGTNPSRISPEPSQNVGIRTR